LDFGLTFKIKFLKNIELKIYTSALLVAISKYAGQYSKVFIISVIWPVRVRLLSGKSGLMTGPVLFVL
jgi:hypothetical protein